jgi:hypothetical protein
MCQITRRVLFICHNVTTKEDWYELFGKNEEQAVQWHTVKCGGTGATVVFYSDIVLQVHFVL